MYVCRCPWKPEDVGSPGAGVRRGSEIPDMASEYQTWVWWESSILVRVSVVRINHHDQSNLGKEFISGYTFNKKGKSRLELMAEPGGRN